MGAEAVMLVDDDDDEEADTGVTGVELSVQGSIPA